MTTVPPSPQQAAEVPKDKSVGAALALTFFFGPFGMLYTTVGWAILMIVVAVVVALFTIGFGLIVIWPISMIWAAVSASKQHQQFEMWKVSRLSGRPGSGAF
ncbi:MAG: hypothetical protein L0H84_20620 [Pseudonocardia sp.]|nr:hypothetical protein [Pseudonocardia sp.]